MASDEDGDVLLLVQVDVSSLYCRASREAKRETRPMAVRRAEVVAASMLVVSGVSSSVMVSLQVVVVLLLTLSMAPPERLFMCSVLLIMGDFLAQYVAVCSSLMM